MQVVAFHRMTGGELKFAFSISPDPMSYYATAERLGLVSSEPGPETQN